MLIAILLVLFLIGFVYNSTTKKWTKNQTFFQANKNLVFLLGTTILPIIFANVFVDQIHKKSKEELFKYTLDENKERKIDKLYEDLFKEYPDSLPLRIEYIDQYLSERITGCDDVLDRFYSFNSTIQKQSIEYAKAICACDDYQFGEIDYDKLEIQKNNNRFQNYILGKQAYYQGEYNQAKNYFFKEIELNPDFEKTYIAILELLEVHFPHQSKDFFIKQGHITHLPISEQRYYAYKKGSPYYYIRALTIDSFTEINLFAFLAALAISIIWLIFLRSLDIYHKEKWRDILIVFIGGTLFANLCIISYDFFHYTIHFRLDGTAWNDFWYCTIVIGGSEEIVKLLPWIIFAYFSKKLKEPYDYILYASISALGFAFIENWMYLENPNNIVIRSIMSSTSHMFDASIIAYAIILSKYKAKKIIWKISLPIIGFILASLSHGFYDFWLISSAFSGMNYLTIGFFILSIHIWFYFKNNAINNSSFYKKGKLKSTFQLNIITFGLVSILMIQYLIIAITKGAGRANSSLVYDAAFIGIFIAYLSYIILKIEIIPGKWRKYKLKLPRFITKTMRHRFSLGKNSTHDIIFIGQKLKIFVPKSNTLLSHQFPKSGICIEQISINENDNYYLFELNKGININGFIRNNIIIRTKRMDESLGDDKVEILLLLIPSDVIMLKNEYNAKSFRLGGAAFSRPIE